jgi:hypothetical protein
MGIFIRFGTLALCAVVGVSASFAERAMVKWTLLLIAEVCCLTACQASEKTFDRNLAAPAGGHLTVDLAIGSASIIGSDVREVIVHARMRGPDDVLSQLTISTERNPSGLRVIEHAGTVHRWFGATTARVQFTIEVPRDYPVLIKTSGGSLDLQNLHASVQATTVGGSITMRDVVGSVSAHTYGGTIRIADAVGGLDLHTVGGSIWLENVDGRVSAETTGGGVSASMLGDRGILLLTYGGGHSIRLQTTGGSILLVPSADPDFTGSRVGI